MSADLTVDAVAVDADWRVRLDVNPGWTVVGAAEQQLLPTDAESQRVAFSVAATGKEAPAELVATIRVDDPSGEYYGTRTRRRFAAPEADQEARAADWKVKSSEITAASLDVSAEVLVRGGARVVDPAAVDPAVLARVVAASGVDPAALLTSGGMLEGGAEMTLDCEFRYVTGQLSYWDIHDSHVSDATGTRLPSCDDQDTTCDVDDPGCCFRSFVGPEVRLFDWDLPGWTSYSVNPYDGTYVAWDSCWQPGHRYQVTLAMTSTGPSDPGSASPGDFRILNSSGATDPTNFHITGLLNLDSGSVSGYDISVNQPANPYTTIGEDANLFTTVWRTLSAVVDDEGDDRFRWGYGTTSDQLITVNYYGTGAGRYCATNAIWVPDGDAGGQTAVYLLGYIYNGRVTGCSGTVAAYPHFNGGEYDPYTGEGNALVAAIPATLLTVSYFDPQVATNTSVYNYVWPCYADGYSNVNRASSERNNFLALWEFIDADTSNTSGYGYDYLDLTLKDVMDGLVDLRDTTGTPGQNRTSNEQVWVLVSENGCTSSDYCSGGHVCRSGKCYTGDPHGENVRDLVDHVADVKSGYKPYYTSTLKSSPCIGPNDETYPYTGGYRED